MYCGLWAGAWADEDWNVTIDSDATREALKHLKEIQDYADPSILSWGTEESIKAFLDGNAAICETWPTLGLTQAADDESQSKVVGKWALDVIPHDETGTTLLSAWDCIYSCGIQKSGACMGMDKDVYKRRKTKSIL